MKARTLMQSNVAACRPEETMAEAARIMWEHDCGVVPVVDGDRRLVGIVTDRDICMAAMTKGRTLADMRVREAMQTPVHCCAEEDTRAAIHETMRNHRVRRLPVVDDAGRLAGIVSMNDLVIDAAETGGGARANRNAEIVETLNAICRHRVTAGV